MKKILPYIAIIGIGAFAGNMINIGLSYAIHWQSLDPMAFMESFKVDFPLLLGPTAATLLPAFIATLWLVFLNKENKPARQYWLFAFAALLLINIQTVAYHLPLNLDFMALKFSAAEATSKLQGWVIFHWIRVAVAIVSAVYAIKAFQLSNNN
ncbi:MAG: anthrone oxygenase family protein [Bacteroidia bacterium]